MKLVLCSFIVLLMSFGYASCKNNGTCPAYGNSTIKKSNNLYNEFQVNQNTTNSFTLKN